ncbi:MAG TPA: hypothetical protein VHZ07_04610 [Bryobacteraceae bacterium]|jgi:hypothetical protein|nr:hypothetical protein [Bryobacteraceae bacterium]
MRRAVLKSVALSLALIASGWAAEPLVGTWQLDHQEINGHKKETEPLTLRIATDGDRYSFAFAVLVNNIDFVSMSYSAKLDGTEADVKNANGVKVGTIQITQSSPSHYKLLLKGANRPETTGSLTVSRDGKTLTSDTDTEMAGHAAHLVQSFSRR